MLTVVTVWLWPVLIQLVLQGDSLETTNFMKFRFRQVLCIWSSHVDDAFAWMTVRVIYLDNAATFRWFIRESLRWWTILVRENFTDSEFFRVIDVLVYFYLSSVSWKLCWDTSLNSPMVLILWEWRGAVIDSHASVLHSNRVRCELSIVGLVMLSLSTRLLLVSVMRISLILLKRVLRRDKELWLVLNMLLHSDLWVLRWSTFFIFQSLLWRVLVIVVVQVDLVFILFLLHFLDQLEVIVS